MLERGVREGNAANKQEQTSLQSELKIAIKGKESAKVQLEQEIKKWEDFREKREDIVLSKMSNDRSVRDKAEHILRDFQRIKEEHVRRKKRLQDLPPQAGGPAQEPDDDDRSMQSGGAQNSLKKTKERKAEVGFRSRPTAAEKAAGGYSDSVAVLRARRECWMGHGFKGGSSSSVDSSGVGGGVQQQPKL